jgi:hypothetical protein
MQIVGRNDSRKSSIATEMKCLVYLEISDPNTLNWRSHVGRTNAGRFSRPILRYRLKGK